MIQIIIIVCRPTNQLWKYTKKKRKINKVVNDYEWIPFFKKMAEKKCHFSSAMNESNKNRF